MYTKDAIRYSLNLADQAMMRSLETIEDNPLAFPTEKGGCHPLWVVGHLAFVEGLTHEMLGGGSNPVVTALLSQSGAGGDRKPANPGVDIEVWYREDDRLHVRAQSLDARGNLLDDFSFGESSGLPSNL